MWRTRNTDADRRFCEVVWKAGCDLQGHAYNTDVPDIEMYRRALFTYISTLAIWKDRSQMYTNNQNKPYKQHSGYRFDRWKERTQMLPNATVVWETNTYIEYEADERYDTSYGKFRIANY